MPDHRACTAAAAALLALCRVDANAETPPAQPGGLPTVSIGNCSVTEGTGAPMRECIAPVSLSQSSAAVVSVDVMSFDFSTQGAADYVEVARTVTFPPGTLVVQLGVAIVGDDAVEPNEHFELRLSNPVNATIADGLGIGSIINDDGPVGSLRFAASTALTLERNGIASITAVREGGNAGAVSIAYTVTPGTATQGTDYSLQDGVLTWGEGSSGNRPLEFTLFDDAVLEGRETFTVTLHSPTGGAVLGSPATISVTIEDDEDHIFSNAFEGGTVRN